MKLVGDEIDWRLDHEQAEFYSLLMLNYLATHPKDAGVREDWEQLEQLLFDLRFIVDASEV